MALVKCPECKKKISDQCKNCPQCGYPMNNQQTTDPEEKTGEKVVLKKKPIYKKAWFWVVIGVALVGLVLSIVLLLTRDTKPQLDEDGNPIFVELTNEVYTNAKDYLGYHINIKGKVFQVMGDNGNAKSIQVWLDPDTCKQNLIIYYSTNFDIKQGDYIMCSGYIDSVTKYKNAYGATLYAPSVISSDLVQTTYVDVMAPTTETITPENLNYKKHGYSVSIDKIEFSRKETRVYTTITNSGNALLYVGDAVIVQDGRQFDAINNYEAQYEEISHEIIKGASSSGIIVFPAMSTDNFNLYIDMHSNNHSEMFDEFVFTISKHNSNVVDFGYKSTIQDVIDLCNGELENISGLLPHVFWIAIINNNGKTISEVEDSIANFYSKKFGNKVQSFIIAREERLTKSLINDCLEGIENRYGRYGIEIQSVSDGYIVYVEVTMSNGEEVTFAPVIIKIDDNWYWTEVADPKLLCFMTGPFVPAE